WLGEARNSGHSRSSPQPGNRGAEAAWKIILSRWVHMSKGAVPQRALLKKPQARRPINREAIEHAPGGPRRQVAELDSRKMFASPPHRMIDYSLQRDPFSSYCGREPRSRLLRLRVPSRTPWMKVKR